MKFLLPYQRDDIDGNPHDYKLDVSEFAALLRGRHGFSEAELEQKDTKENGAKSWPGYLKIDTENTLLSVKNEGNPCCKMTLCWNNLPLITKEVNLQKQGRINKSSA